MKARGLSTLLAGLIGLSSGSARADGDRPSEADMFGEPSTPDTAHQSGREATKTATAAREGAAREGGAREEGDLFGGTEGGGALRSDREVDATLREANDKLQIGGMLYLRFQYNVVESGDPETFALRSPNLLDVYLDARPVDRLRAYVRGRVNFDPTLDAGATDSGQPAGSSTFGFTSVPLEALLDQLWLKTDIERTVFVTLGRQRVKWGSGHTWNPTDFLNRQKKNPLDVFDVRTGVSLVKVHVPVEKLGWNFYAIGSYDDGSSPDRLGGALRWEALFGETEVALTGAFKKDSPQRLGFDVSSALSVFDVHAEAALLHHVTTPFYQGPFDPTHPTARATLSDAELLDACQDPTTHAIDATRAACKLVPELDRKGDWIPQVVVGADVQIRYSDDDSVILGAEYFYNDAGYDDKSLYSYLLAKGALNFFYLGRHYASAYAVLAGPGSWDNTTVTLTGLSNLSDKSAIVRLDYQVKVLGHLMLNAFGMTHVGSLGELRFGLDVPKISVFGVDYPGYSVPAPLFEVGGGLRMDL